MARHRGRGRHGGAPKAGQAADAATGGSPDSSGAGRETAAEGGSQAILRQRPPRRSQPREGRERQRAEAAPEGAQANVDGTAQPDRSRSGATRSGGRGSRGHQSDARPIPEPSRNGDAGPVPEADSPEAHQNGEQRKGCTLAQMRRFIKSRPYVPVHELRRRFEIEGVEDEVSAIATDEGTLFVGLPSKEAEFLGELIKAGEVGYEQLLDPVSPALVGVFPMRPVARQ